MTAMLDIIEAVEECKKHECHTIAVSTCEKCPSFFGIYRNLKGRDAICCIYPEVKKGDDNEEA